ncbi:MAG: ankyrin repeat domain-containing protein [Azoarcus sp.]|jgi:ankyrin repeat protein|nr:ankyrin repeat domain-containing protein [Azoarcus sp.]
MPILPETLRILLGRTLAAAFFAVALLACTSAAFADGKEEARTAARRGDTGTLTRLLESGAVAPDTQDDNGNTLLILAVREGNAGTVAALLRFNPQLDHRNRNGDSALMLAALGGDVKLLDLLLAKGAKVNSSGWTALHYAALEGKLPAVEKLIAAGADVNALTPNLSDALMLASRNGHIDVVRRLLKTPIALARRNDRGVDAEAWARSKGNTNIADLIKKTRAERTR